MKRSGDIASLFQKHEAKKKAAAAAITSNRSPDPVELSHMRLWITHMIRSAEQKINLDRL